MGDASIQRLRPVVVQPSERLLADSPQRLCGDGRLQARSALRLRRLGVLGAAVQLWTLRPVPYCRGVRAPAPWRHHDAQPRTKKRFLHSQILTINSALYRPEAVALSKRAWRPLVTVIIRFRTVPAYLKETLASLEAQTTRDFEIVLVNDGSDDPESLALLDQLRGHDRIRVLDCANRGPAAARNLGATWARAELLVFLDSDNLLDPSLEKMCWTIARHPEMAFVYSGVVHFGDIQAVCYDEFDDARLKRENYLTITCVMSDWWRRGTLEVLR